MWERDEIKEIISELKNEIANKLYDKASELNCEVLSERQVGQRDDGESRIPSL